MTDIEIENLPPASWIWSSVDPDAAGQMAQLRLRFTAEGLVYWYGFADTFYYISCNGIPLGTGPILAIHDAPYLSCWDLSASLQPGENELIIEVWFDGRNPFASDVDPWQAGVIGWLITPQTIIPTGPAWQARGIGAFTMASAEKRSFAAKRIMIADFRAFPGRWETAQLVAEHPDPDRPLLRPAADFPNQSQNILYPASLIDAGFCHGDKQVTSADEVAELMWEQKHESLLRSSWQYSVLSADASSGTAIALAEVSRMKKLGWQDQSKGFHAPLVLPANVEGCYLTWDMGLQTNGLLRLEVECEGEAIIDLGYADHLHQGRVHPGLQGHSYADRLLIGAGRQLIYLPVDRAYRYVQISCRNVSIVHNIWLEEHLYPHDDIRRYSCSDETINQIWDMACATLHQCSLTSHVDNARRERQGWGGPDFYAMLHGFYHAFGDPRLSRKEMQDNIDIFEKHGFIPNWCPAKQPAIRWISAHDLWFPLICRDFFLLSGDSLLLEKMVEISETVLRYYSQNCINGLIGRAHANACRWVEWNMNSAQEISTWENLLAAAGWAALADMQVHLGLSPSVANEQAESLKTAINAYLWHPQHQALAQGTREGGLLVDFCAQLDNTFALLHDLFPQERITAARNFCAGKSGTWPTARGSWQGYGQGERVCFDPRKPVVAGTPFASSVCAQAIHRFQSPFEAVQYLRYNFGSMIDEGEGTCWEMWPVHQREDVAATCFSQGYGAHVTATIINCLLGVSFIEPGGKLLRWQPRPCGLAWQKGRVETIYGPAFFQINGNKLSYQVPEAVKVVLDIAGSDYQLD